jgi:glycosyltransferase involved in cell wall biosynthesis
MMVYPSAVHRRLELRRMRQALAPAAAIVMNTPLAAEAVVRELPSLNGRPVVAIPNGYDAGDFETPPPRREDGAFRIVHTGYLHTDMGLRHRRMARSRRLLGGARGEVDFLTRSHVYLLDALGRLIAAQAPGSERIELHLAGALSDEDRAIIDRFPHRERVHVHGYVAHGESLALMRSADLLFFPMQDLPEGDSSLIVPGKAYEYLASGRPIAAAVPDGDARSLLQQAEGVHVSRPSDAAGIAEAIAAELQRPSATPLARDHLLADYERRRLTERLARLLDSILDVSASAKS